MIWPPTILGLLLLVAILVSAAVALYAWQRRSTPGARQLVLIMLAVIVWTLAYVLELSSLSLDAMRFWSAVAYLGIASMPTLWVLFVLAYTGRTHWLTKRALVLWFAFPTLILVLNWTNASHLLYYRQIGIDTSSSSPLLRTTPGPWYWAHITYSYLALAVGMGLLWDRARHAAPFYRQQVGLILLGVSAPWLASIIYVSGLNPLAPLDITPFAFVITGLAIAWGLFHYRLFKLVPMAREHVLAGMIDPVVVLDVQHLIVDLNRAARRLFEEAGTFAFDQPATTLLAGWPVLLQACQEPHESRHEVTWDGPSQRWFEVRVNPIFDQGGHINGWLLIWHDITTCKQATEALEDAAQRFEAIIEQTPLVAIQRFDRAGVIKHWNAASQTFFGYSASEAISKRLQDLLLAGAAVEKFENILEAIWSSGQGSQPRAWRVCTKDGEARELYSAMFPLMTRGQVSEVVCMDIDITSLRQAEATLRRQHDYLAVLHRLTLDWLNRREMDDLLQAIVDSAAVLLESPCSELMLKEGDELVVRASTTNQLSLYGDRLGRDDAPLAWQAHDTRQPVILGDYSTWPGRRACYESLSLHAIADIPIMAGQVCLGVLGLGRLRQGQRFEPEDLQRGVVFAQLAALVLDNASLYAASQREIAEHKQTAALLQSRLRFIELIQQASNGFIRVGVGQIDAQITAVLHDVAELFGVERGYVFLIAPERGVVELSHEWCSGDVIPHQGILDSVVMADFADYLDSLRRGEIARVQARDIPRVPANQAMLDVLNLLEIQSFVNIPLFISEQLIGWIGFDAVTCENEWAAETVEAFRLAGQLIANAIHRKQTEAEQARLLSQLIQSQKMEAIGHLAGGIAHDFNNILTVINGNADLALSTLPVDHPAFEDLQTIQTSVNRAVRLVRQLLTFARRQASQPEIVDLNELVQSITPMLRRLISAHIRMIVLPDPALRQVKIDPHQFEQVVINLIVNARDAMPEGGILTITTANVDLTAADTRQYAEAIPGTYVRLTVSDTGVGMTDTVKARIFEPYFSTKDVGQGTGLGLATCLGIVKQHRGFMWVESAPQQGSHFNVYLPCTDEAPRPSEQPESSSALWQGTETVLVVEDEPDVRLLTVRFLTDQGYTVFEAGNGQEALDLANALAGEEIHLLLTDLIMPVLGGLELAQRLQAQRPGLRVLFMSGYANQLSSLDESLPAALPLLQKPFSQASLLEHVRQALL